MITSNVTKETLAAVALFLLLGAGCTAPNNFEGPDNYVSPPSPPPSTQ